MKNNTSGKKALMVILGLGLVLALGMWSEQFARTASSSGYNVTFVSKSLQNLEARWAWAVEASKKNKVFYIGYSVKRLMGEHSYISCGNDGENKTLHEIIYGTKAPGSPDMSGNTVSDIARHVLKKRKDNEKPEKKVWKDVGLLFRFEGRASNPVNCKDFHFNNMEMPVKLKNAPIYWLGETDINESVALLVDFYRRAGKGASEDFKEDMVSAVGIHGKNQKVFAFLKDILTGKETEEIRDNAAFWISQQQSVDALKVLQKTVESDRSENVREKAVFGIYLIKLEEADNALIHLAKNGKERGVRKKAIFWLGQKAVKHSARVLADVAYDDKDTSLQRQAVFALSQLPDNGGVDSLIKIARTHKSMKVRKKAIFWLSQCDDPRALNTIIDILQK
jgi:hypothetical protein